MKSDSTDYLAHFTKSKATTSKSTEYEKMSALERLISILSERKIGATRMPWTDTLAVCFTESPWSSLLDHSKRYSPYGIGFSKKIVFNQGGNPVWYINSELYRARDWSDYDTGKGFLTPFSPDYAEPDRKIGDKVVDYSHEREWRVLNDFIFDYEDISFVVLDSIIDCKSIPSGIVDSIGPEKFIFMDMYRRIETLWPTHRI